MASKRKFACEIERQKAIDNFIKNLTDNFDSDENVSESSSNG